MITKEFLNPKSIVVVGGSNDLHKPGGKVIKNLKDTRYPGDIYIVNPKADTIQELTSYHTVEEIPGAEVAILAIPAALCLHAVETLCSTKGTKGVIIFSAGFSEESHEGAVLEKKIRDVADKHGATLIGPNCVGYMNEHYAGVFTSPIPRFVPDSIDLISGSGATALFIIDAAVQLGIPFANVFSVGNSAQTGLEEALEYLDQSYVHGKSAPVKLIYAETIKNPLKLWKHAASLYRKGARIAAVKAGSSEAGSRAASSHTGALASPDTAVAALFEKAGIIRCNGRNQLLTVACILLKGAPAGKNMCIITHAGGPAVMLTDVLSENGIAVPTLEEGKRKKLLAKLFAGSSAANPIDFLATGTAGQLGEIIEFVENECPEFDGMAVIFGSPGLNSVFDVYDLIHQKMSECTKPIYPIFPSTLNVLEEIREFQKKGRLYFPDEVIFGSALAKVLNTPVPVPDNIALPAIDEQAVHRLVDKAGEGYLSPAQVSDLLDAAGIPRAQEAVAHNEEELGAAAARVGFPLVMKVIGPVHKSDVGGVRLNIRDEHALREAFREMITIKDTTAILLQSQLTGRELFIGAKREPSFGHTVVCGLGGIFVEVLKDISTGLSPVSPAEAGRMVRNLRGYGLIRGVRGQEGVNEDLFIHAICRVSALCRCAPEIAEMDLNPLLGTARGVVVVDARIRIERS
ncbi:MAG TPA: acetate--CoA ligase family protein [Bacteroidales bacterium]|jgi:acetyltransferase|nr:acetate--CoA ligase family protein [Bacteroidales bacterium]OQC58770.1 MAG: CoA binding domain protein [Bacteroidetes bacterium ADurb.Bin013]MBP8999074.1 acetate--CoA ligase family protein [Bacteroidales bacterium]MBV6455830.1 Protein lysine acetyltransferase Pat [Bacteroidales bacterium]NLZ08271.1 acetate--CoA ligase family protein [Bacteroidales bacterium]